MHIARKGRGGARYLTDGEHFALSFLVLTYQPTLGPLILGKPLAVVYIADRGDQRPPKHGSWPKMPDRVRETLQRILVEHLPPSA